ncbi:transcriptional regulator protein [Arthrobacter sp. Hiyo8]|nr:transcriptional regulator protein [Arthrobacter sp. Hiyo8]
MEPAEPGASVTLRDVAAASGVSLSTASRALDERGPVSRSPRPSTSGRLPRNSATAGTPSHQACAGGKPGRWGC